MEKEQKISKHLEIKQYASKYTYVKEEVSRDIRKYFKLNKNKNTMYQNLWDVAKAVFSGELIKANPTIRREERSQFSNINFQFKKLEKE